MRNPYKNIMRFTSIENVKSKGFWGVVGTARTLIGLGGFIKSTAPEDSESMMNWITHSKEVLELLEKSKSTEEILPLTINALREAVAEFDTPEVAMMEKIRLLEESQEQVNLMVTIRVANYYGEDQWDIDSWELERVTNETIQIGTPAEEIIDRLPRLIKNAQDAMEKKLSTDLNYSKRSLEIKKQIEQQEMALEVYRTTGEVIDIDLINAVLEGDTND